MSGTDQPNLRLEPSPGGTTLKYGQIVGSDAVNAAIYRCFEFLSDSTARSYVKKFRDQPHDQDQAKHTFRELILGAFIASHGHSVDSERKIDGKTPDWSIVENGGLKCIIEAVIFHYSKASKDQAIHANVSGLDWTFVFQPDHTDRLYNSLYEKCIKYKDIVIKHEIAYVPALFVDFDATVDSTQLRTCLFHPDTGLFAAYPHVSGVHIFMETVLAYRFHYIANPNATHPFTLPEGDLTSGFFHQRPEIEQNKQ
jgi:hypothetical protein